MTERKRSNPQRQGSKGRKPKKKGRNDKKKHDPVQFWGAMDALPTPESFRADAIEPLAIVHSLGPAPLPGVLAEPYFAAVYDRSSALASILSDAAGLSDLTPELAEDDADIGDLDEAEPDDESE